MHVDTASAIRFALYAALLALLGAAALVLLVLRRVRGLGLGSEAFAEDAAARARRIALAGAIVILTALPARLIVQSFDLFGDATSILGALTNTQWGRAWMLQVAGAIVALAALPGAKGIAVRRWRVAALGALAVAAGFSLSGHAAAVERFTWGAMVADLAHVTAAGVWAGTLGALAAAALPAALAAPEELRGATAAACVNAFSPLALLAAATLAVTGTFAAWEQLDSLGALSSTMYGRTLLLKLALIAVMAAIGALNWRVLRPRLGTEEAARALRRSAVRELVVAILIVAVTAVLVATPAHDDEMSTMSSTQR